MPSQLKNLQRSQIDSSLEAARECFGTMSVPKSGWIRAIRQALGMTTAQLARRMEISQPSILDMETREREGGITLKALRNAAAALNCELHYVLLPRTSLEGAMRAQAELVAKRRVEEVAHSMSLEEQAMSKAAMKAATVAKVEELLAKPRNLWAQE